MKTRPSPSDQRRGAALLLSILVLFVVITIVFQISIGTMTDARVARNDVGLTTMDLAIKSCAYDIFDQLQMDAEAAQGAEGGGGEGSMADMASAMAPGGEGAAQETPPSDSREDEWGRPQRQEINDIQLRVLVQDESGKYNVLNVLSPDEDEAEAAFRRVVRILDKCREGTAEDIEARDAEDMAEAMRRHMLERDRSSVPRPKLLTDDEKDEHRGLPLSLREFCALEKFEERHFRDYRDENGTIVHSIGSFLTVWSSPDVAGSLTGGSGAGAAGSAPATPSGAGAPRSSAGRTAPGGADDLTGGGQGDPSAAAGPGVGSGSGAGSAAAAGSSPGYGVNLNTAPPAVLKSLIDDRDVSSRFWDDVIEYRNLEQEDDEASEADEEELALLDEYGEEILKRRIFDTLDELSEVRSWGDQDGALQERVRSLLTTQSQVFSIFITARRSTAADKGFEMLDGREAARREEESASALVRTVRMVVWRREVDDGIEIVPIIPWETVDYVPFEVVDYPEDDR